MNFSYNQRYLRKKRKPFSHKKLFAQFSASMTLSMMSPDNSSCEILLKSDNN